MLGLNVFQVFGGRRWSADSVGPQHGGDHHNRGFQRTSSFVGGHNRAGRQKKNQYTLPVSLGRVRFKPVRLYIATLAKFELPVCKTELI